MEYLEMTTGTLLFDISIGKSDLASITNKFCNFDATLMSDVMVENPFCNVRI